MGIQSSVESLRTTGAIAWRLILEAFPRRLVLCLLVLAISLEGFRLAGFHTNFTDSAPLGILRETPIRTLARGQWVAVCAPIAMPFLGEGPCANGSRPLLKTIVAGPGDRVAVTTEGVRVNGGPVLPRSAPRARSRSGVPLPQQSGEWILAGYWLYGPDSEFSYDSRYFGAVPPSSIRSVVKPVWVWQ